MKINYDNPAISEHMLKGGFGLEKEGLRVDGNGNIAHTSHPFSDNKKIERDFCENQVEIITSVHPSVDKMMEEVRELNSLVAKQLLNLPNGAEYMWPFSNPPKVNGEDDIPIAVFQGERVSKTEYRRYLGAKYGKKKMLYSGIHYNFSFADEVLRQSYADFSADKAVSFKDYNNQLYLELSKKVVFYSWFIVYLTAASPVYDGSLFDDSTYGCDTFGGYGSVRCSEKGYWNFFTPTFDYTDMQTYTASIASYVDSGDLYAMSELYYPVRLKSDIVNSLTSLVEDGVNHIELRMLDVNPLTRDGIFADDLKFIHLFLVYLSSLEGMELTVDDQQTAIVNEKKAALYSIEDMDIVVFGEHKDVCSYGESIIKDVIDFYHHHKIYDYDDLFKEQLLKFTDPCKRYCQRVYEKYGNNYNEKGLELAKSYSKR